MRFSLFVWVTDEYWEWKCASSIRKLLEILNSTFTNQTYGEWYSCSWTLYFCWVIITIFWCHQCKWKSQLGASSFQEELVCFQKNRQTKQLSPGCLFHSILKVSTHHSNSDNKHLDTTNCSVRQCNLLLSLDILYRRIDFNNIWCDLGSLEIQHLNADDLDEQVV